MGTKEGRENFVSAVKRFPQVLDECSEINKTRVTGVVSFGRTLWNTLVSGNAELEGTGAEMFDFPGYGKAPATQADFYVHIHSKNGSVCFDCASMFMELIVPGMLTLTDSVNGFIWRDSRDLTGFIDGTENPSGTEDREAASLNADRCSFALVQRFEHNLKKWGTLDREAQESVIGRTKPDSVQLEPLPMGSHVAHTDIDDNGVNEFVEKARTADGFVFAAPVYYAHPSGRLLSVLDRMFYAASGVFCGKVGAAVVSARRAGTTASLDVINKYFGISGMPVAGSTYWGMVHGGRAEDVLKDEEGLQTMRNLARNMAYMMKSAALARENGLTAPDMEKGNRTNFIR